MTQLSAMPTVSKLSLHRETVVYLGGGQRNRNARGFSGDYRCTNSCGAGCTNTCYCTFYTCAKHCTKKPGGCLA